MATSISSTAVAQPNVIVFFSDQQRWDTLGVHGNPLELTPNLDRVAQRATHVDKAFTCQPLCGPARAALQTGLYPTTSGCFANRKPLRGHRTLAHHFAAAGYDTGYIGKWHLAGQEPVSQERRGGYDFWMGANLLEFESSSYDTVLFDQENRLVKLPGYRVDALTDQAINYVANHQERPFFLFVSHVEPHHQNHVGAFLAPDGYRERYTGRWMPPDLAALGGDAPQGLGGYYGSVKRLDEAYGRLLDALRSLRLDQRTIVAYTSDHGCHFNTRNAEYKRSCHDASIRVPLVLCGPGFEGGGRVRELASLVDLPPTLLEAAGIQVPIEMQGRSFMPLLQRRPVEWAEEVYVQISEDHIGRAIRTADWKYSVRAIDGDPAEDPDASRYVEDCLYDLEADPYELTNLAGFRSHREVANMLRERLFARMVSVGERCAHIEPAPEVESWQRLVPNINETLHRYRPRTASAVPPPKS